MLAQGLKPSLYRLAYLGTEPALGLMLRRKLQIDTDNIKKLRVIKFWLRNIVDTRFERADNAKAEREWQLRV